MLYQQHQTLSFRSRQTILTTAPSPLSHRVQNFICSILRSLIQKFLMYLNNPQRKKNTFFGISNRVLCREVCLIHCVPISVLFIEGDLLYYVHIFIRCREVCLLHCAPISVLYREVYLLYYAPISVLCREVYTVSQSGRVHLKL